MKQLTIMSLNVFPSEKHIDDDYENSKILKKYKIIVKYIFLLPN